MMRRHLQCVGSSMVLFTVAVLFGGAWRLAAALPSADSPVAAEPPSLPIGDQRIESIQLLAIPGATTGRVQAAVASGKSIYLAGKAWNLEDKESLWLWRVDGSGRRLWEKRLARQEKNWDDLRIVGFLPGERKSGPGSVDAGVRVVYRHSLKTWLSVFDAGGKPVLEKMVGSLGVTESLVNIDEDHTWLLGEKSAQRNQSGYGWIACMATSGTVEWKQTFTPGVEVKAGDEQLRPKARPIIFLMDGTRLKDGSIALVGQTGVFNKFGQGPAKLWLLRLDRDGNKLAEAFIDEGRLYRSGRHLIAACGDGLVVPYTTDQLPPISGAPYNFSPNFGINLARYDAQLKQLWNKPLSTTGMPGAVTITGPTPFVSLTAMSKVLLIRAVDEEGKELWRSHVATHASVLPLAVLRMDDEIIAVCNYRANDQNQEQQVLLIHVKPSRSEPGS